MYWCLAILWMAVIFWFSAQEADESSKMSSGLLMRIIDFFGNLISDEELDFEFLHLFIRKAAHFTIYGILGTLVGQAAMETWGKLRKAVGVGLKISFFYALSDELHQTMIAGRSGQLTDVLIDIAGALVFLMIWALWRNSRSGGKALKAQA
nr:VanZ family protein [Alkalibacter mobilis]